MKHLLINYINPTERQLFAQINFLGFVATKSFR